MTSTERRSDVRRFTRAERMVHRTTAALMLLCVITAAFLYVGPLARLVGQRNIVATVHEWSGVLLPVPVLLGLFSSAFRADLRRLNRFAPYRPALAERGPSRPDCTGGPPRRKNKRRAKALRGLDRRCPAGDGVHRLADVVHLSAPRHLSDQRDLRARRLRVVHRSSPGRSHSKGVPRSAGAARHADRPRRPGLGGPAASPMAGNPANTVPRFHRVPLDISW